MYRGKIASIILRKNEAEGVEFLDVELEILSGEDVAEVVEVRRLAFPVGTPDKDIKTELKKYMQTYNEDAKMAIESQASEKEQLEKEKEVSKIKDKLEGQIL